MKGQTQIITAVLILGIAVVVISATYAWGAPLIQQSQASVRIATAKSLIERIDSAISEVAQTGGQKSISVSLEGQLEISETNNSITYTLTVAGGAAPKPSLQEATTGIFGKDKAGVIIANATPFDGSSRVVYKLVYRELAEIEEPFTGHLIKLCVAGGWGAGPGQHTVTIRQQSSIVATNSTKICNKTIADFGISNKSRTGGELVITPLSISIS